MPIIGSRGGGAVKGFGLTSGRTIRPFIEAEGGTILTCGDYKTHVFTGDGTFNVKNEGTTDGSNSFEYLVVAGGANGGSYFRGGGGGAGGFRENYPSPAFGGLAAAYGIFPITVGGGGGSPTQAPGSTGSPSTFSSISSTRGGNEGQTGGSGGGTNGQAPGPAGNLGGYSPPEGFPGGRSTGGCSPGGGGGGGATQAGSNGAPGNSVPAGPGGNGAGIETAFFGPTAPSYGTPGPSGSFRYFSGGGGGGTYGCGVVGTGGTGGGGTVNSPSPVNSGGGGGAGRFTGYPPSTFPSYGGSGLVAIRYKFQ